MRSPSTCGRTLRRPRLLKHESSGDFASDLQRSASVDRKWLSLFAASMNVTTKGFLGAIFFGAFATAEAELAWERTEVELHPKAGDAETVANFKFQNKGDKPVKITAVKTSCGCTAASSKKDDVAPGEKGEITATFKIGGRTGVQQKVITVETDDAAQPSMNLLLKAVIEQPVQIQPVLVYWESGEALKPKTIKLKANKDVSIKKVEVTSSAPEFTSKVEKGSGPGEYNIVIVPNDTTHPVNATLTIKSDLPQTLYASARVTGTAPATDR